MSIHRSPIEEILNEIIHAYEDSIDNYAGIEAAIDKARPLVPGYDRDDRIFDDRGDRIDGR